MTKLLNLLINQNQYPIGSLPNEEQIHTLVERLQKPVCAESCQRKESSTRKTSEKLCRFKFPHFPLPQTMIARHVKIMNIF